MATQLAAFDQAWFSRNPLGIYNSDSSLGHLSIHRYVAFILLLMSWCSLTTYVTLLIITGVHRGYSKRFFVILNFSLLQCVEAGHYQAVGQIRRGSLFEKNEVAEAMHWKHLTMHYENGRLTYFFYEACA